VSTQSERLTEVEKTVADHEDKIVDLKKHKHLQNNELQNIGNLLQLTRDVVTELKKVVSDSSKTTFANTKQLIHIKAVAVTIVVMGSAFASFIVFVGGKVLKWW